MNLFRSRRSFPARVCRAAAHGAWALALAGVAIGQPPMQETLPQAPAGAVVRHIQSPNELLEMVVNTNRLVQLDGKIPRIQVGNPDLLEVTPTSPNEFQFFAKKTGLTKVTFWNENNQVFTVDVIVTGDMQELLMTLRRNFPKAAISVWPTPQGIIISGRVDDKSKLNKIIETAESYFPSVINNLEVGGVQQIALKVKVMEISRTKLRQLGVDFAYLKGTGTFVSSGITGLVRMASLPTATVASTGVETFSYGVLGGGNNFFSFIEALRQDDLAKVLAEPDVTTISGRPSYFNVGGEFPILIPQSLGTVSIQYRPYGTQVDFMPLVLGNGNVRLEVRPRVSEIDNSRSVTINGLTVPALRVREVDTAVELQPGQTLVIAGLVSQRIEATRRSLPVLGDLPYVGMAFRNVREQVNEIELLIMVTPQLVEGVDPNELPPCGPGQMTDSPTDTQLYLKGHLEVPRLQSPDGGQMPGGLPPGWEEELPPATQPAPSSRSVPAPPSLRTPAAPEPEPKPVNNAVLRRPPTPPSSGVRVAPQPSAPTAGEPRANARLSQSAPSDRYDPQIRTALQPRPQPARGQAGSSSQGFIGPIGYDDLK